MSVVVPTYNYGRFVGDAIGSVLRQSFTDFELLVVDDGSTDDTAAVVAGFPDPRVRYVHQPNRGLAAARNTGIRESTGEFVAFLDADDLWLPEKLDRQLARLQVPSVGLVHGAYEVVDEQLRVLRVRRGEGVRGDVLRHLAVHNVVAGSATTSIVRRSLFDRTGVFDVTLRAGEDWDMWQRLARVCAFDYVPEPIAQIRLHGTSMSRDEGRMLENLGQVVRKFYDAPDLPDEIRPLESHAWAALYLTMARFARNSRRRRRAAEYILRAIRQRPTWPDPWIRLFQLAGDLVRREPPLW